MTGINRRGFRGARKLEWDQSRLSAPKRMNSRNDRLDNGRPFTHSRAMIAIIETLSAEPTADELDQLLKPLVEFNSHHTATIAEWPHLGIVLRQPETEEIVGGLYGFDELNWLFVKYLVVPEALRGKGLGRQLMGEAERIARERGYLGIFLDTYDFQAKPFYLKLGYEQFGELEGDDRTPRRFFLRKVLSAENRRLGT